MEEQSKKLDKGVDVLIATPGRLLDLFERGGILLKDVKVLVIDEADCMLDMGFIPDVEKIVSVLNKIRQTLFFSATMPPEVLDLTGKFMRDPARSLVKKDELTLEGFRQFYIAIEKEEWTPETMCDLCETLTITQAIIYCNTRRRVDFLKDQMEKRDFTCKLS